jgi:hypothetical protein
MPSDQSQKVQLGCGTLILIALIVLFFSNGGNRGSNTDLENKIRDLSKEVHQLRSSIESQTQEIHVLQSKLDELKSR